MTRTDHRMKRNLVVLALPLLLGALLLFPLPSLAQGNPDESEGMDNGNYHIKQTFEIGYRWEGITGNRNVYNTFVNLNGGPRLFEHSLEMRSLNHQGLLFDNFSLHSFGYGGDPNDVTRLRMYKNKWYNFNGTFRRDRNFWDYRLLANPLNPNTIPATAPATTPIFNIPFSPHRMEITRRMYDFSLVLAPQSPIRVRLNYSRSTSEGPSLSTFHEGTDVFLLQNWKNTLNSYQVGIDFKVFPKTNISFDQFFHFYKGDTTFRDPISTQLVLDNSILTRPIFQLSNGALVDPGAIFNFFANAPCSSTATTPFIINAATTPPTMRDDCNGYFSYRRGANLRTMYPTSQVSFQSSYFKNFDISGRLSYSNADLDSFSSASLPGYAGNVNFNGSFELMQGLVTRTAQRQFAISGPIDAKRYNITGDFAATWYATHKLRFTDVFRYDRFRIPGTFDSFESSLFVINSSPATPTFSLLYPTTTFTPGLAPPASCPTITSPGCPRHNNSSPADLASELFLRLIKQRTISNEFNIAYDFTREFGGELGYRVRQRRIEDAAVDTEDLLFFPTLPNRQGCTPGTTAPGFVATNLPDGSCRLVGSTTDSGEDTIWEHTGLFGLWYRPNDRWRATYDMELTYADFAITRISPRQRQRYKGRISYKATEWATISGHVNFLEQRNNVDQIFHRQHNRTAAFAVILSKERWGADFGYDWNDISSKTNICFTLNTVPLPPGSTPCPNPGGTQTTSAISTYFNRLDFAYFNFMFKPIRRVTAKLGYTITSTSGDTLILGPINAPRGTLSYNYHKPYGGVEIELDKHVMLKSDWNYYGYNEKSPADVFTSPVDSLGRLLGRDFRGNLFTTSVRFVF